MISIISRKVDFDFVFLILIFSQLSLVIIPSAFFTLKMHHQVIFTVNQVIFSIVVVVCQSQLSLIANCFPPIDPVFMLSYSILQFFTELIPKSPSAFALSTYIGNGSLEVIKRKKYSNMESDGCFRFLKEFFVLIL